MSIFIVCPRPDSPSGGVYILHRIADLLTKLGKESYVLQEEPFSVFWDANPIPQDLIKYGFNLVKPDDILFVPEVLWNKYADFNAKKVCVLQNWIWSPPLAPQTPTVVVSRYLANYAKRNWNADVIGKVTPFLDADVWGLEDKHIKDRVLVMARRNNYHQTMKYALEENGFTVDYVTEPLTQRELADRLNTAEYYVHLTHPEGFPMICLEAMRSKTLVVGTTGGGGCEFMFGKHETAYVVQDPWNGKYDNSHAEFQKRILEGLSFLRNNPADSLRMKNTAYDWSFHYTARHTSAELSGILTNEIMS